MVLGRGGRINPARVSISLAAVAACALLCSCAHTSSVGPVSDIAPEAAPAAVAPAPVSWPTNGWATSTPEAQGIDSAVLADALEQIRARHIPIHSLLIERHGTIVLDSYFYPFADNHLHNVYSVTKSVTSMLVGIAQAEHRLDDLDTPVYPLLAVQTSNDPRKAHITLGNLLSMTSGLDCRGEGHTTLLQEMLHSPHLASYMLNRPTDSDPGKVFNYCGGNSEVVSAVLTRETGSSALAFARSELFTPLGITTVSWPTDSDGVSHGWGDLELQPRDMAKLGYLWLHNGRWEGKQIIPAGYLAEALTRHIGVQPGIDYGYGMWLYPGHTPVDFEANGTGGQRITVIPSLDMVEVMTGGGFDANVVQNLVAGAARSQAALPANPGAVARLEALEAELTTGPAKPPTVRTAVTAAPGPRAKSMAIPRIVADVVIKPQLAIAKGTTALSVQPKGAPHKS